MEINLGKDHFMVIISATKFDYNLNQVNTKNISWIIKAKDIDEARTKGYKLLERFFPGYTYSVNVNSGCPYVDNPLDDGVTISLKD